ncbi:MAG TPA: SHOCT domain-containing protein [Pseudonocardia sp.]|nr:SHOCT domain-containing protein [Pseudonocardia sp.]
MPGLLRGVARTGSVAGEVAGTATAVSHRVSRHRAGRGARQDRVAAPAAESPRPTPAGGGTGELLAQLPQSGGLYEQGVLADAEPEQRERRIPGA